MGAHGDHSPVLVTGGSGFIGTNLIERLVELGIEVINIDTGPPRNPTHRDFWRQADILDPLAILSVIQSARPTGVIHLAARTDLRGSSIREYATNTDGTRNLLAALGSLNTAPRLIVASTRMVCKIGYQPQADDDYCPPNLYGESKVECEQVTRASGYPGTWLIVRPTSIWGPWFDVPYRDFFLAVAKGRYRHPAGKRIRKSFGYVENTVHQLLGLLAADREDIDGRLFYLADYEPIEVSDWAAQIQRVTGGPPIRPLPELALRAVALSGDLLKRAGLKEPPLTRSRLDNLLTEMIYDLRAIEELVPSLPVPVDVGVGRTAEWLRGQGHLGRKNPGL